MSRTNPSTITRAELCNTAASESNATMWGRESYPFTTPDTMRMPRITWMAAGTRGATTLTCAMQLREGLLIGTSKACDRQVEWATRRFEPGRWDRVVDIHLKELLGVPESGFRWIWPLAISGTETGPSGHSIHCFQTPTTSRSRALRRTQTSSTSGRRWNCTRYIT